MCHLSASQTRQKRLLKRRENGASQGAGKKPSLYRSPRETVRRWHNLLWRCRDWIAALSSILCRVLRNADLRHCCFIAVKFCDSFGTDRKDGSVGEESAIKKSKIIFNFFRRGYQSTRFRVFSRYSDPAGRKASEPGKGGIVSVLLLMTELIVIFVFEGCRRDLNGASGQTAL